MKNFYSIIAGLLIAANVLAQAPQKMSYQAIVRDGTNALVTSSAVGMQISILQGSASGTAVYVEIQTPTSNANGLVSLEIGAGTVVSGSFNTIDWANGPYFIKTDTDPAGGTNYTITGTSQLLSVPYALYAVTAGNNTPGPQGPAGSNGTNGADGSSAYEIAVANGFVGSEAQWLTSLVGATGAQGPIGLTGATGATGSQGPIGLTGPAGATGPQGPQGPAGTGSFTHYIGEEFGGGVVFHLWKDASGVEHGLIVDKTDLSTSQVWSNINGTLIGASAQSSWDGLSNSNAIAGQAGHTGSAAALCLNSTNGGQSDWYLPSIDELSLLWHSRFNVNKSLSAIGGATVLPISAFYWSSTEYVGNYAWGFGFNNGNANFEDKSLTFYVRAVRAF